MIFTQLSNSVTSFSTNTFLNNLSVTTNRFTEIVLRYAVEHSQTTVVIKTKPLVKHLKKLKADVNNYLGDSRFPDNLVLTNNMDPTNLILESRCILGFNSTVLMEALLCNKQIICPKYSGVSNVENWDLFEGHENLATNIDSYDQLVQALSNSPEIDYRTDEEAVKFLEKYLYSTDCNSSKRIEGHLSGLLG